MKLQIGDIVRVTKTDYSHKQRFVNRIYSIVHANNQYAYLDTDPGPTPFWVSELELVYEL